MASGTPVNPDLPTSILLPGVYLKLNLSSGGASLSLPSKRMLLIGCKTSAGTAPQDTPIRVTLQKDVDIYAGVGSELSRMFAAVIDEVGSGALDVSLLPIAEPSSGTAAAPVAVFMGTATGSGSCTARICGYPISIGIAVGDTPTVMAASMAAAINLVTTLPITASPSSGTVTMNYRHKGLTGNDIPRSFDMSVGTGVTVKMADLTFTTTATSTGGITISVGSQTVTYTVTSGDTANTTGTGVANAINASGIFPATATSGGSGGVVLLYAPGRVGQRITASMGTVTGTTVAVTAGTLGAGAPTLTTALVNMNAQSAFPAWVTSFNDGGTGSAFHAGGGASSSLASFVNHITSNANGYTQKEQQLTFGSTESLSVSGGYQTATGLQAVNTDGEGRFAQVFCPDSPQQAYELACRVAARRLVQDFKPKNYAGMQLSSQGRVPLQLPHNAVQLDPASNNAALLSYYMTPLAVNTAAGAYYIVRDRTTSPSQDQRNWSWSTIDTAGYIRSDLGTRLSALFSGKSFKKVDPPATPNVVTEQSIKEGAVDIMRSYSAIDFVDDIVSITKGITANQDPLVPNRVDVFVPFKIPVPLYQIGGNVNQI